MTGPLLTLLDSIDPDIQSQGVELGRALGGMATERVLASCVLAPDGRLWRPLGLSAPLLSLLLDAPPTMLRRIRRLTLCGSIHRDLLGRISRRIPGLTSLTLSAMTTEDLSPLTPLSQLRSLSILRSTIEDLSPLTTLRALRHLSLDHCRVLRIGALSRLSGLTSLSLEGVDAPSVELPARLTTLNVRRFYSTIPSFEALPLRVLTLDTAQLHSACPLLPRLSEVRLIVPTLSTDIASLAGQAVTELSLHAAADSLSSILALPSLHTLRLVGLPDNTEPLRLAPLRALPALSVVSLSQRSHSPLADYSPRWVPDARLTRWLLSSHGPVVSHPLNTPEIRARARTYWLEQGRSYRLDLVTPDRKQKLRSIKALRSHVAISFTEAKGLLDVLLDGGLRCLSLAEAVELQGWLRMAGMPARLSCWTA